MICQAWQRRTARCHGVGVDVARSSIKELSVCSSIRCCVVELPIPLALHLAHGSDAPKGRYHHRYFAKVQSTGRTSIVPYPATSALKQPASGSLPIVIGDHHHGRRGGGENGWAARSRRRRRLSHGRSSRSRLMGWSPTSRLCSAACCAEAFPPAAHMMSIGCGEAENSFAFSAIAPSVDQAKGLWPSAVVMGWKWSETVTKENPECSANAAKRTRSDASNSSLKQVYPCSSLFGLTSRRRRT